MRTVLDAFTCEKMQITGRVNELMNIANSLDRVGMKHLAEEIDYIAAGIQQSVDAIDAAIGRQISEDCERIAAEFRNTIETAASVIQRDIKYSEMSVSSNLRIKSGE